MKKVRLALGLSLALVASVAYAAGSVKSGPQVSEELAGPFHPLNVTGAKAGQKHCLYCQNGNAPVVMIFAREVTPEVTNLIKKVDEATAKHSDNNMGSFVVFLSNDDGLKDQLKAMADKNNIKETVLSIDNPAGPQGYKVSKDADVTVVFYVKRVVKANHSFKKGELSDADIDTLMQDLSKILPK